MQENQSYMEIIDSISEQQWKQLSRKNIYFGHQSVGFNIMDGVTDIMADNDEIDFTIKETSELSDFDEPVFAHSRNGENRDWQSKIDGFRDKINDGLGDNADMAFFKLCYVDITGETDVQKLFESYRQTMDQLQKAFPETVFIHATAPLKTTKTSWKTWIKKLIGKDHIWEYADNIKRNEFNDLMRQEYESTGRLFDIAKIESTYMDGSQETFEKDGNKYAALVPSYTYDGGHLNELGRKIVAAHLLNMMAGLAD
ncbi:MAG: hypothetical protein K9J79_11725 [Desulfobacteraceae bacterium]|nr:hypothetical protein [Desulfobacteraceae bacterium]MCF8096016.1 hypothetical protein [Desulfobacteraceae bacterium]